MTEDKLTFEEKIARLDTISKQLQDPQTGLTQAVDLFEEGMRLAKEADCELSAIERRIDKVVSAPSDGELVTEPYVTQS